jgi:hypothetical protein
MPHPTSHERPISVSAFARARRLTHSAVRRAIDDGRLRDSVVQRDGMPPRILASLADIEWRERTSPAHTRAAAPPPPSFGPERLGAPDDYRRSLVIEKVVKTRLAQMLLDEKQGRLIDAAQAGDAQFEIARLVRNQMLELPDRLADELALETDAHRVREILMREVNDVLRKLALQLRAGALQSPSAKSPPAQAAAVPTPRPIAEPVVAAEVHRAERA